jgi:hypothetical protein
MANSRMHWRVKQKAKKAYWELCGIVRVILTEEERKAKYGPGGDNGMGPPPAKAKVRATIYCGGRMDHDNAMARLKWPIDWLVSARFLAGDKPSQLEWHWPIEQVVKRNQQYRVELELEPLL